MKEIEHHKTQENELPANEVEVSMVFRHFHPILAGAAERFRRYSVPLAKQGVRFRVFTLKEGDLPEFEQLHDTLVVHRIAAEGKPWERDAVLFEAAYHYLKEKPTMGHVFQTSLAHAQSTPWLKRIRKLGFRCIYAGTMVGGEELEGPLWRRLIRQWRYRGYYAPFNRVIASSTVMAAWFSRLGVRRDQLVVIPNGVNVERFHPAHDDAEKQALRLQLGLPATGKIVIFVGNIIPRKGVHILLNAWLKVCAQVKDTHLVLVGGFERPTFMTRERMDELAKYQDGIRELAARPEAGGSVIFAGETKRVEDWLRLADLFVFASEQEGMPNAVLEAMASGLPSIITEFQGMPEVEFGKSGKEFLLIPRNEDAMAEGVLQVISDSRKSDTMKEAARTWTVEKLDVNLTLERYAKVYQTQAYPEKAKA